jgi:hypothetical protein
MALKAAASSATSSLPSTGALQQRAAVHGAHGAGQVAQRAAKATA